MWRVPNCSKRTTNVQSCQLRQVPEHQQPQKQIQQFVTKQSLFAVCSSMTQAHWPATSAKLLTRWDNQCHLEMHVRECTQCEHQQTVVSNMIRKCQQHEIDICSYKQSDSTFNDDDNEWRETIETHQKNNENKERTKLRRRKHCPHNSKNNWCWWNWKIAPATERGTFKHGEFWAKGRNNKSHEIKSPQQKLSNSQPTPLA